MPIAPSFDSLPEAAVLSAPPAPVTPEQARAVLAQFYDLPPASIRPLSGERDANFLVELTAPDAA
ncbi:MAG: hypothetical protein GAK30_02566 [Paracidovorax wautersii]|uniref:Uncharacterized protein n=1 Tax=Paracidovorax wautersii TaxID=1177982 RepID=A0A7V8JPW8_9BURK|nr:MAG: hypothetical protein GAK30_02566 [Paracidovorax wautersii]